MKKILFVLSMILSLSIMAADIDVKNAEIRVMPPKSKVTAITFDLKNTTSKDIALVSAAGDFAGTFEIHTMGMDNGKMEMKKLDKIVLKKNSTTEFKKGGYHIMVFDPKADIAEGKEYSLTLHFDNKKTVVVKAVGKKPFEEAASEHHGHH